MNNGNKKKVMSKILVTGSKGFIGSRLMKRINADGIDFKDGTDARCRITKKYDVVIHLAALMKDEKGMYENNVESTMNVVNYCASHDAHLIFASSAAVYGNAKKIPTPESYRLHHVDDYGESKIDSEILCKLVDKLTVLRFSNVYPKKDSIWGLLKGKKPAKLYDAGRCVRDFIHVDAVVDAIKRVIDDKIYGTFNISSGVGISIRELAEQMKVSYILSSKIPKIKKSILDNTKWKKQTKQI